jgi:glycosyltransferase involved in cell wall biosynthesis
MTTADLPRVSIVTPSYNQAQYLEATIRSVLDQGYPNLEYLVLDGGSTDGSVDIIRRYAEYLAGWTSERDRGQADAINRGLRRATGAIVAWLNSDDILMPGAIRAAVQALDAHPEAGLAYSDGQWIDERGNPLFLQRSRTVDLRYLLTRSSPIPQPTVFMRRAALEMVGYLNESLHLMLDYELWVRFAERYALVYVSGQVWAGLRQHADQKTWRRLIEGLNEQLRVMDAAIARAPASAGLSERSNELYARIYWELAAAHAGSDWRQARHWLGRALRTHPARVALMAGRRAARELALRALPPARLRGLRGRLD